MNIISSVIAFVLLILLSSPAIAGSACGEKSCYSYCDDACNRIPLEDSRDIMSLAVKACKKGCTLTHWQYSSVSGKVNCQKGNRNITAKCLGEVGERYKGYCIQAYIAWKHVAGCYN